MSGDVRKKVENYVRVLAAMEHEVFLIVLGLARNAAEHAIIRL